MKRCSFILIVSFVLKYNNIKLSLEIDIKDNMDKNNFSKQNTNDNKNFVTPS